MLPRIHNLPDPLHYLFVQLLMQLDIAHFEGFVNHSLRLRNHRTQDTVPVIFQRF